MKLKLSFLILFFSFSLFANDVLIALKDLKYKEIVDLKKVAITQNNNIDKNCKPLALKDIEKGTFVASHFINKGNTLCLNDILRVDDEVVVFDFGTFEIEQKGRILFENDEYIRVKKLDGSVEKIYKNGQIK